MKSIFKYIYLLGLLSLCMACGTSSEPEVVDEKPPLYPDYTDIVIPYNIAPLNFMLRDKPSNVEVAIKGKASSFLLRSGYKIRFTEKRWRHFLESEKGNTIEIRVKAKQGKQWVQYLPFTWKIAADRIDPYLSYRMIEPGYEVCNAIRLIERHLESFEERVIADNNLTDGHYINSLTYCRNNPTVSFFYLAGEKGGMVLNRQGELRKLNIPVRGTDIAVYGEIHPSGRFAIFSSNKMVPEFYTEGNLSAEVKDASSDIYLIDFDTNTLCPVPFPNEETWEKNRTLPVFSPDGTTIYYWEAPVLVRPDTIDALKYNLQSIYFDAHNISFGTRVDTLYSAIQAGKPVSYPKVSPDGKYLLYTIADYDTSLVRQGESDLQMMHLYTHVRDSLENVNGPYMDSYPSWSSKGNWLVFAGTRDDGIYEKPYFAYIDSEGKAHKPFVMPQKDPAWYDYTLKSFHIPEFSTGKLPFNAADIETLYWEVEAEECSVTVNLFPERSQQEEK